MTDLFHVPVTWAEFSVLVLCIGAVAIGLIYYERRMTGELEYLRSLLLDLADKDDEAEDETDAADPPGATRGDDAAGADAYAARRPH